MPPTSRAPYRPLSTADYHHSAAQPPDRHRQLKPSNGPHRATQQLRRTANNHQLQSGHPTLAPPTHIEYPYGTAEGVGISTSQIPNAGRGLFGLRPLQDTPHLFAKQGQLICTYATQRHQISVIAASTLSSRYLWSTNHPTTT